MENGVLYQKNIKAVLADELLNEKSSFDKITQATGWTTHEIWLYIDMIYRRKYPKKCEENKDYFCWGTTKQKTKTK